MTVAEFIVNKIVEYGVTDVFGIPGGVVLDFLYTIDGRDGINAHLSYNEQAAAYEACGYAQCNHSLGVAYATRGPGVTNLITGIADAYSDSIPVVFITAHADKVVENLTRFDKDQELNIVDMVKNITKYAVAIDDIETVQFEIDQALKLAMEGRKGPVLLDISSKLWNKELVDHNFSESNKKIIELENNDKIILEIANEIKAANRPLMLIGDGIQQTGTQRYIKEFSEKTNMPIVSSRGAQDVAADCENYFGYIGSHGIRYANFIFEKSDMILALGNRMSFPIESESYRKTMNGKKVIRVDIDEKELQRTVGNESKKKIDLKIVLPDLTKNSIGIQCERQWLEICRCLKQELAEEDNNIVVSNLVNIFRKLKGDEILVSDVGNHEFWVSRGYELAQISNRILYSKTFGTLGNAVGKAIGAYYREKKRVVCFIGDQGIQLNIQELQLIAQERIPIAIVIINNNSSGMIMDRERQKYGEHLVHTTQESGYGAPDFKMIADAYRIEYLKATQITKKETDIIVNQKRPILLELMIDKDMKLEPNLPKGETMQKMIPNLEHDRFEMLNKL